MKFAAVLLIALVASTAIAGCAKKSEPTTATPTGTGGDTTTSGTGVTTPTGGSGTNGTQAPMPKIVFNGTMAWNSGAPEADKPFTVEAGYTSLAITIENFKTVAAGPGAINDNPQTNSKGGVYLKTPGATTATTLKNCANQVVSTTAGEKICDGGSASVTNAVAGEYKISGGGIGNNAVVRVIVTAS